jgi:hypothetical protein
MTPEAQKLAQALFKHHRTVCRLQSGEPPGVDLCVITYGDLCERAGLPHLKATVGKYLREIAEWCQASGWPPLNALAVNHDTGRPGRGYNCAPGCSLERWESELAACIKFADYPAVIS